MFAVKNHFNVSPAEYEVMRSGYLGRRCRELVEQALEARADRVHAVLEVGAGTGSLLAQLADEFPDIDFLGIDVAPPMVSYAQRKYRLPNLSYMLSDITDSPRIPHCEFVFSVDTIHHVREPSLCFRAVRRALDAGDAWLVIEPNIFNPCVFFGQERMRRAGLDEDHLCPWVVEPLMKDAGFAIAARQYAYCLPASIKRLPPVLRRIERCFERFRFLGGNVVYTLVAC